MGSVDPQVVKNFVFGSPSTDKKFKEFRMMNSLKICPHQSNYTKSLLWNIRCFVYLSGPIYLAVLSISVTALSKVTVT